MELFTNLELGFVAAFSANNLLYCFLGVLLGTAIGVLPGLGPMATIAMLLPVTYVLDPITALIMLAGIYYGAQYGGSTTAILINLPGEASSVVTAIDGHKMAQKGRAGAALAIAALASLFAGTVSTAVIAGFSPLLASVALSFRSPEYFSLMVLGLIAAVILAHGSILRAVGMVLVGLLLGCVGVDATSGVARFTGGWLELSSGIDFIAVSIGIFAFAEIISNLRHKTSGTPEVHKVTRLWPTREDIRRSAPAVLRGTGLGSILGLLPGGGATLASFASYTLEKRVSSRPSEFGEGAVEGVAGPESANNAAAQTSFIPMLVLGIPSNGVMALMMGAMMIHNIAPGPQVMTSNPELFWGLIVSMWVGNFMLLVLNLPLVGLWVRLVSIPYNFLYPAIMVFCVIGIFSTNNQAFQIIIAAAIGVAGYFLSRLKCEMAPFLLGFVLGPMLEENFRRSMQISRGSIGIFVTQPISACILIATALIIAAIALPNMRKKRAEVFADE